MKKITPGYKSKGGGTGYGYHTADLLKPALKTLLIILATLMILTAVSSMADVSDAKSSGSCGDDTKYVLNDEGVLTLKGYGKVTSAPWSSQKNEIKQVIIKKGVTNVDSYAFSDCELLESVKIPSSVSIVEYSAFSNCVSLESISLPYVKTVESNAFSGCTSLKTITMSRVESIGDGAFSGTNVESIKLPKTLTEIKGFNGCKYLKEVSIPSSATSIGNNAFRNCISLESLKIPSSVLSIGGYAFYECKQLSSISIPKATTIGNYAFYGCDNLSSVSIPKVETISSRAFQDCSSLSEIKIPSTTTSIGTYAFSNCLKITEISLPKVTSIGSHAFSGCLALSSISMPRITSIGDFAFSETSLTAFKIPKTLTAISGFGGCTHLSEVTIQSTAKSIEGSAFSNCISLKTITIPSSVTSIGSYAFSGCEHLTSISLPKVTSIGSYAFIDCTLLSTISMPKVTSIGGGAFSGTSLETIKIPRTMTEVGGFSECTSLKEVTITSRSTSIKDSAFSGCTSLKTVTIPSTITSIGGYAFYNCAQLSSVTASKAEYIGGHAFFGCSALSTLKIPRAVTIEYHAFDGCKSLASVSLTKATYIGSYAFYNCCSLNDVSLSKNVNTNSYAFYGTPYESNKTLPEGSGTRSSGSCGSDVTYVLKNDGTLTIRGYGKMESRPWSSERADITSVVIKKGVTSICNYAFSGCSNLKEVTIPSSLSTIGYEAFSGCTQLTSISLPRVTSVGFNAFCNCTQLSSITMPELASADYGAFMGCDSLVEIKLPSAMTSVSDRLFEGCSQLTTVSMPNVTSVGGSAFSMCEQLSTVSMPKVTSIGYGAFKGSALESITIPKTLKNVGGFAGCYDLKEVTFRSTNTSIGNGAFENCKSLTTVKLPSSVVSIGNSAFSGCTSLSSVKMSKVTSIGSYAFAHCISLEAISMPAVTSINGYAFQNCSSLSSISMPKVTSIGDYAFAGTAIETFKIPSTMESVTGFSGCKNLKKVTIPKSVTSIGNDAFKECSSLTSISMPRVTSIGNYAFKDCKMLSSVSMPRVTYIGSEAFSGTSLESIKIPTKMETVTGFSGCDSLKSVTITSKTTSIGDYAFQNCVNLSAVTIPSSVKTVGNYAFQGCDLLSSVSMPKVTSIGDCAFDDCDLLSSVSMPKVTSIGDYTFSKTSIESIEVPSSLKTITGFSGCSSLKSVTITSRSTAIGDCAFYGCYSLESIDLPTSITSVGNSAFSKCSHLFSVNLPKVTTIGNRAFNECLELESVSMPKVKEIGEYAFNNTALKSISIPTTVTCIKNNTFSECNKLSSAYLPKVTTIGENAFYNCKSLETICLPSAKTINTYAFANCDKLSTAYISKTLAEIGNYAFTNCKSLANMENTTTEVEINFRTSATDAKNNTSISPKSPNSFNINAKIGERTFSNNDSKVIVNLGKNASVSDSSFAYTHTTFDVSNKNPNLSSIDGSLYKKTDSGMSLVRVADKEYYTMPKGVVSASPDSLAGSDVKNVVVSGDLKYIPAGMFRDVDLGVAYLEDGVEQIENGAFSDYPDVLIIPPSSEKPPCAMSYGIGFDDGHGIDIPVDEAKGTFIKGSDNRYHLNNGLEIASSDYTYFDPEQADLLGVEIKEDNTKVAYYDRGLIKNASRDALKNTKATPMDQDTYRNLMQNNPDNQNAVQSAELVDRGSDVDYFDAGDAADLASKLTGGWKKWVLKGFSLAHDVKEYKEAGDDTVKKASIIVSVVGGYLAGKAVLMWGKGLEKGMETLGSDKDGNNQWTRTFERVQEREESTLYYNAISGSGQNKGLTSIGSFDIIQVVTYDSDGNVLSNEIKYYYYHNRVAALLPSEPLADSIDLLPMSDGSLNEYINKYLRGDGSSDDPYIVYNSNDMKMVEKLFANCHANLRLIGTAAIDKEEYKGCKILDVVSISPYISSIGQSSFAKSSARSVLFLPEFFGEPDAITIGNYAFMNCKQLECVLLPDNLHSLGKYAFAGCTSMRYINIPASIEKLGANAFKNITFYDVDGKTVLNQTVEELRGYEYYGDGDGKLIRMATICLGDEITVDNLVYEATSVDPLTVSLIGYNEEIETLSVPDSIFYGGNEIQVVSIGDSAFKKCTTLTTVDLGNVENIESKAFAHCSNLKKIDAGDSLKNIGPYAFYRCNKLKTINFENSSDDLETIDSYAFYRCNRLNSISIPAFVKTIGEKSFSQSFLDEKGTPIDPTAENLRAYRYNNDEGVMVRVINSNMDKEFESGKISFKITNTIPGEVQITGYSGTASELTIPEETIFNKTKYRITSIGDSAFKNCKTLTSVNMPSIRDIGSKAFYRCTCLEYVLADNIEKIGTKAFANCFKLSEVELSNTLETLCSYAFYNCSSMTSVYLYDVKTIGSYAFYKCESLSAVHLYTPLTSIGKQAFDSCQSLSIIEIPSSVKKIGSKAFGDLLFQDKNGDEISSVKKIRGHIYQRDETTLSPIV